MIRRTTIELDEDLVAAARAALGQSTVRGTVEEALRRAVQDIAAVERARRERQVEALRQLAGLIDEEVLFSGEAWR